MKESYGLLEKVVEILELKHTAEGRETLSLLARCHVQRNLPVISAICLEIMKAFAVSN